MGLHQLIQFDGAWQQPAQHMMCRARQVVLLQCIGFFNTKRRKVPLFVINARHVIAPFETRQGLILKALLQLIHGQVAKGHEHRITGVVMAAIKCQQIVISKIGYAVRLSPTVIVVSGCRKQVACQGLPER